MNSPIRKLSIANRAGMVLHIVSTTRRIGLQTVTPWHQLGQHGPALLEADKTFGLLVDPPVSAWLNISALINAVRDCDAYYSTQKMWDNCVIDPVDTRNALSKSSNASLNASFGEKCYRARRL